MWLLVFGHGGLWIGGNLAIGKLEPLILYMCTGSVIGLVNGAVFSVCISGITSWSVRDAIFSVAIIAAMLSEIRWLTGR